MLNGAVWLIERPVLSPRRLRNHRNASSAIQEPFSYCQEVKVGRRRTSSVIAQVDEAYSDDLGPSPCIGYTRKSSESQDMQKSSHETQRVAIEKACPRPVLRWFED